MRRSTALLLVALTASLTLLIAACGGDGAPGASPTNTATTPDATASPPAGTPATATPATATPAATAAPPVCLRSEGFRADGDFPLDAEPAGEATVIAGFRWQAHQGCERFVIDLAREDGSAADTPGALSVELIRERAIVRVHLPETTGATLTAAAYEVAGPLARRAFHVRDESRALFVDLHLGAAAEAAVTLLDAPARVVVDLRPGGGEIGALPAYSGLTVMLAPRAGAASYPLTVTGYARHFEANVVVRLEQGGEDVVETVTTATDWTEAWGSYALTIEDGPTGPVTLHVGDYSARDGSWEGLAVELAMQ